MFSREKCPSRDSACASLSKIATLWDPSALNVSVSPPEAERGPVSSLAKKIERSKPTRWPARNAEHQRLNADVALSAAAAGPTNVES